MKKRLAAVLAVTLFLIVGWPLLGRTQQISMPVYAPPIAPHTIEVVGRGEVRVAPDLASLDFAIETHDKTADQAASDNAQLAQKVMQALQSKLGDKGKMWTLGYTLMPDYSDKPDANPKITGYRAANSVHVETGAIDLTGALIDAAIGAGANRVDSIDFGLRDESKARNEAITKAAKDAQTQAQTLATALGVKLKGVFKATTEGEERPMPRMARAVAFAAAPNAPTPIQPNQVTVPATVSLAYEIE